MARPNDEGTGSGSRSSIAETLESKYRSQNVRPVLTLSIGIVTVGAALASHIVLHANVSFALIMILAILSVVIPRCRAVFAATLGMLYGLVLLPVCIAYAIFTRKDPGEYLTGILAKIVDIIRGSYVQTSESVRESGITRESTAQAKPALSATPSPSTINVDDESPEPVSSTTLQVMAEQRPDERQGRHARAESEPLKELAASARTA